MDSVRRPRSAGAMAAATRPTENHHRVPFPGASDLDDPLSLRRVMDSMPPSAEVLDFYRAKVNSFEADEKRWSAKLAAARGMGRRAAELESALDAKDAELRALRKALVEMQGAVSQERKRSVRAQADADRARLECREARRKVDVLLRTCGRSDAELTRTIALVESGGDLAGDWDDGQGGAGGGEPSVLSEQLKRHIEATRGREYKRPGARTLEGLRLEVTAMEAQILEQERCHIEQVSTLQNERRVLLRERDGMFQQYEQKAAELSKYIKSLDRGQGHLTKELEDIRVKFRRCEREWLAEKETLYRKLQLCQQQMGSSGKMEGRDVNAGFFTDQRSASRLAGDARTAKKLQKANSELAEHKAAAETYRGQLLAMEAEMDALREQNSTGKEALKRRTKAMADQIETLRQRCDEVEKRKRTEARGYQSDVRLLQQKIKQVEQQLVKAAVAKSKEHDYIRAIKAYDRELEKLKTAMRKSPDWIN